MSRLCLLTWKSGVTWVYNAPPYSTQVDFSVLRWPELVCTEVPRLRTARYIPEASGASHGSAETQKCYPLRMQACPLLPAVKWFPPQLVLNGANRRAPQLDMASEQLAYLMDVGNAFSRNDMWFWNPDVCSMEEPEFCYRCTIQELPNWLVIPN